MARAVTLQELQKLVEYDADTGIMRWRLRAEGFFLPPKYAGRWNAKNAGGVVGALQTDGGLRASINKRLYEVSRLAFMLIHKVEYDALPPVVDHKDGCRANNRASNLRAATKSQNNWNSTIRANNSTGHKGISIKGGRFRASICVDYRQYEKTFATLEEAVAWREQTASEKHQQFACGNQHSKGGDVGTL